MIACTLHTLAGPALLVGAFTVLAAAYRRGSGRRRTEASVRAPSHVNVLEPPYDQDAEETTDG